MNKTLRLLGLTVFTAAALAFGPSLDATTGIKLSVADALADDTTCVADPCIHHGAPHVKTTVKIVKIYVERLAPKPKKKSKKKVAKYANGNCVWTPFSNGPAAQPVVFFRYKEDADCLTAKTKCQVCTDWINGKRGPVFGPASQLGGGVAYAVPQGSTGVMLKRNPRGKDAYCDQAVGSSTYSWPL